jgi:hypothetical protein
MPITTGRALPATRRPSHQSLSSLHAYWRRVKRSAVLLTLLFITPDTKAEAGIKVPTPCGRISPFAYLEPTETVAQAPRFARHLIDKRRHPLGLTTRKMRLYRWYMRHMEVLESTASRPRVELRCSQDAKSRPLAAPRANTRAATREPACGTHRTCHDLDFDAGGVIPDAYFGRHGAPAGLRPVGAIELLCQPVKPKALGLEHALGLRGMRRDHIHQRR